jgi:hypothetical protein
MTELRKIVSNIKHADGQTGLTITRSFYVIFAKDYEECVPFPLIRTLHYVRIPLPSIRLKFYLLKQILSEIKPKLRTDPLINAYCTQKGQYQNNTDLLLVEKFYQFH